MGKSRKKTGIVKDRGLSRAMRSRIVRRVNRQRIKSGQEPFLQKELINPYDVHDWIHYWNKSYWVDVFSDNNHRRYTYYKTFEDAWRFYFGK